MIQKPSQCNGCLGAKWDDGDGFIRPEGTGRLGIHIVGEAAGKNEAVDGLPFRPYAQAGSILTQCIKRAEAGLDRSDFLIHNLLSCRPPNDLLAGQWYEQQVIDRCAIHRNATFKKHLPKVILALGATAFRTLTGYSGEEKETLSMMRGYPLQVKLLGRNVWVVPSFHPAYIARGKRSLIPVLIHDIRRALDVARKGWRIEKKDKYILYPSIGDAKEFLQRVIAQPEAWLSFDLENPEMFDDAEDWKEEDQEAEGVAPEEKHWEELKQDMEKAREKAFLGGKKYASIKTIQFSLEGGTGICLPWVGDYLNFAKMVLRQPNPKVGQNCFRYDVPILRENGIEVNGHIHDLMWMMHHLWPDLEGCYHLQGICSFHGADEPWKHKAHTNPEFYGCEDVSNPLKAIKTLIPEMKSAGVWNSYLSHITELNKVLDAASARGLGFDQKGAEKLSGELAAEMKEVLGRMRELCPDEVRLSKQKEGYAKEPKDTKGMIQREFTIQEKTYSEYKVACICENGQTKKGKICERCKGSGKRLKRVLENSKGKQVGGLITVVRWCSMKPFVPSNKQLIRYMEHKGHSVPKHARTSRPTTDERAMKLLSTRTKDPMYPLVTEYKGIEKLKSSYVDSWKPYRDGRIHTTFGFHPSTGQLNSRDPNCFSGSTEVLTKNGWMFFADAVRERPKEVAQYDVDTGEIDFEKPLGWITRPIGPMVSIRTFDQIALEVTPDHRCLVRNRKTESLGCHIAVLYPKDGHQIHAGKYVGGPLDLRESQLILIAALQADGSINKLGNTLYDFSFTKKRKADRLLEALLVEGIPHRLKVKDDTVSRSGFHYRFGIKEIPEWWGEEKKFFGPWLLDLSQKAIEFLAREVLFWDGHDGNYKQWTSTIRQNADWVQILQCLSDRRGLLSKDKKGNGWRVNVTEQNYSGTANRTITKLPDAESFCVTMPKGTVIVRTNSRSVCITHQCQQLPKHKDIADRFRQLIIAPKSKWLCELDYKSFHGCTTAFEAEDPDYMRLAKIDLHSYLTSDMVGQRADLRWDDKKLIDYLKEIRKAYPEIRDTKAKRAILGYQFGMTGYLLFQMWREIYEKQRDAEEAIARIDALFPKQVAYRNRTVDEAWTRKHLKTRYGYIRWFWDAKKYNPAKKEYVWAEDAKKAIAYRPANDAHAMMKERMLYLAGLPTIAFGERKPPFYYGNDILSECSFLMPYHDALIFEMDAKGMDKRIEIVKRVMEAPDPLLRNSVAPNGLSVGVDVKIGGNLGKEAMKKWEALRKQKRSA